MSGSVLIETNTPGHAAYRWLVNTNSNGLPVLSLRQGLVRPPPVASQGLVAGLHASALSAGISIRHILASADDGGDNSHKSHLLTYVPSPGNGHGTQAQAGVSALLLPLVQNTESTAAFASATECVLSVNALLLLHLGSAGWAALQSNPNARALRASAALATSAVRVALSALPVSAVAGSPAQLIYLPDPQRAELLQWVTRTAVVVHATHAALVVLVGSAPVASPAAGVSAAADACNGGADAMAVPLLLVCSQSWLQLPPRTAAALLCTAAGAAADSGRTGKNTAAAAAESVTGRRRASAGSTGQPNGVVYPADKLPSSSISTASCTPSAVSTTMHLNKQSSLGFSDAPLPSPSSEPSSVSYTGAPSPYTAVASLATPVRRPKSSPSYSTTANTTSSGGAALVPQSSSGGDSAHASQVEVASAGDCSGAHSFSVYLPSVRTSAGETNQGRPLAATEMNRGTPAHSSNQANAPHRPHPEHMSVSGSPIAVVQSVRHSIPFDLVVVPVGLALRHKSSGSSSAGASSGTSCGACDSSTCRRSGTSGSCSTPARDGQQQQQRSHSLQWELHIGSNTAAPADSSSSNPSPTQRQHQYRAHYAVQLLLLRPAPKVLPQSTRSSVNMMASSTMTPIASPVSFDTPAAAADDSNCTATPRAHGTSTLLRSPAPGAAHFTFSTASLDAGGARPGCANGGRLNARDCIAAALAALRPPQLQLASSFRDSGGGVRASAIQVRAEQLSRLSELTANFTSSSSSSPRASPNFNLSSDSSHATRVDPTATSGASFDTVVPRVVSALVGAIRAAASISTSAASPSGMSSTTVLSSMCAIMGTRRPSSFSPLVNPKEVDASAPRQASDPSPLPQQQRCSPDHPSLRGVVQHWDAMSELQLGNAGVVQHWDAIIAEALYGSLMPRIQLGSASEATAKLQLGTASELVPRGPQLRIEQSSVVACTKQLQLANASSAIYDDSNCAPPIGFSVLNGSNGSAVNGCAKVAPSSSSSSSSLSGANFNFVPTSTSSVTRSLVAYAVRQLTSTSSLLDLNGLLPPSLTRVGGSMRMRVQCAALLHWRPPALHANRRAASVVQQQQRQQQCGTDDALPLSSSAVAARDDDGAETTADGPSAVLRGVTAEFRVLRSVRARAPTSITWFPALSASTWNETAAPTVRNEPPTSTNETAPVDDLRSWLRRPMSQLDTGNCGSSGGRGSGNFNNVGNSSTSRATSTASLRLLPDFEFEVLHSAADAAGPSSSSPPAAHTSASSASSSTVYPLAAHFTRCVAQTWITDDQLQPRRGSTAASLTTPRDASGSLLYDFHSPRTPSSEAAAAVIGLGAGDPSSPRVSLTPPVHGASSPRDCAEAASDAVTPRRRNSAAAGNDVSAISVAVIIDFTPCPPPLSAASDGISGNATAQSRRALPFPVMGAQCKAACAALLVRLPLLVEGQLQL